ncbi:MAG: hypothetical protein U0414_18070 [Polyangiaceae bacterium]
MRTRSIPRAVALSTLALALFGGFVLPVAPGCKHCDKWLSYPSPKPLGVAEGQTLTIIECETTGGCPPALGTRHLVACGNWSFTNDDDKIFKQDTCAYELDTTLIDPQEDSGQVADSHECGYPCSFDPKDDDTRCIVTPNAILTCRQLDCLPVTLD